MKTINELLAMWAELEPETCDYVVDHKMFYLNGCAIAETEKGDGNDGIRLHIMQGETQQAVESRGFRASIRIGAVLAKYRAEIMFTINGHEGMVHADSNDSPAHALIAAYVQALEAVAEVVE